MSRSVCGVCFCPFGDEGECACEEEEQAMTDRDSIYLTIELDRGFPVASLLDLPGKIVSIKGAEEWEMGLWDSRELGADERFVAVADTPEAISTYGEWVEHTSTECPVHPLDVLDFQVGCSLYTNIPARRTYAWRFITHYRHVTDPDGIPYVYDDGDLPEWAEYVATDADTEAVAYEHKPWKERWQGEWDIKSGLVEILPAKYVNTLIPWTETLRRVYRS